VRRAIWIGSLLALAVGLADAGPALAEDCPNAIPGFGSGTVYYVSPAGSDSNRGTSPCSPWQTMGKVESFGPKPGDTIAFEGGQTFAGSLSPWGGTNGTAAEPIFYTSYGTGQADLTAGVYLNSVAYLTLDDLNVTNAAGPGIGTGGTGSGAKHIVVRGSNVSSTYSGGIGGYGIGLRNALDSSWTIEDDQISNTADSGVASLGSAITIDDDILSNNGIGPYCGTGSGQNPCHGIYAKGPAATVTGNTISNPQSVGVSLRDQSDIVQGNSIFGGQKGIAFSSETTTPGTTYIVGNILSGQSDTGIQAFSGTQPLYESLVIASNTVYMPANYGIYIVSGPNSAGSQTVTLANNLVEIGSGARGYLNLAYPTTYTRSTYTEHHDEFYGAGTSTPFYVNGSARVWTTYTAWFGSGGEGQNDLTKPNPMLDSATFGLGSGSPAIGAGTLTVPGLTYAHVANCPVGASAVLLQWQYCGSETAPNLGSR
jgi:hypothetical protein